MIKNSDDKEAQDLKNIYNHVLDKSKEIMKNTQFKVETLFGYILGKESISSEQITELNNFLAKKTYIVKLVSIYFYSNLEKRKLSKMNQGPLLITINFL